jgi:hypothetical protein
MTEADRAEWLRVARITLSGIPADLLEMGCKAAREKCDHPAKIVPTILAETKASWESRRRHLRELREQATPPPPRIAPQYVTAEQAATILREIAEEKRA